MRFSIERVIIFLAWPALAPAILILIMTVLVVTFAVAWPLMFTKFVKLESEGNK